MIIRGARWRGGVNIRGVRWGGGVIVKDVQLYVQGRVGWRGGRRGEP